MHSRILIVLLFLLLTISCKMDFNKYLERVDMAFNNASSIIFKFEKPFGSKILITDSDKIIKIKKWLKNSKPIQNMGSYPDTLVPVLISSTSGDSFDFKISQPIETLDYTIISWDGYILIAEQLPVFLIKEIH